jgi:hypothetical protein
MLVAFVCASGAIVRADETEPSKQLESTTDEPSRAEAVETPSAEVPDQRPAQSGLRRLLGNSRGLPRFGVFRAETTSPSDYWIGVMLVPVDSSTLRTQLGIAEGQGLIVRGVVPDSPAATAGLNVEDIIVRIGEQNLGQVSQLVETIDETKQSELTLDVFRAGKTIQVRITPQHRPEQEANPVDELSQEPENIQRLYEQILPEGYAEVPFTTRFWHPGWSQPLEFPDDLKVQIEKSGKTPAKIHVTLGDEEWNVTESQLHTLPEKVRPHVEGLFMGRKPMNFTAPGQFFQPQRRIESEEGSSPETSRPLGTLEREFKQLNRQFEQLKRSLDELRRNDGPRGNQTDELPEDQPQL